MPSDKDLSAFLDRMDLAIAALQRAAIGLREILDTENDENPEKWQKRLMDMGSDEWKSYMAAQAKKK